jgi:hypothetical protein
MSDHGRSGAAVGWSIFAATMLLLIGTFQAIMGITALVKDNVTFYVLTEEANYFLTLDATTWGWVHLILGVIIFLAGLGVLSGQVWARTVGVIIAGLSAIANFAFIPVFPVWSIVIIAIDVFVIWALTMHGRDITTD